MISALPVSGAWHPNTCDAHCDRPRISFSSASLSCPYPWPPRSGPRCVAHSPRRRTSSFRGSMAWRRFSSSGTNCRSGNTRSSGSTSSLPNGATPSGCSWYSGSVRKSHAIVSPPRCGQNSILDMANAIPDQPDIADRVARQTLAGREAAYADEVRRLLDAALDVMRKCGTTSRPRVADIVAAAGLSNEAFYRHFRSKDALVVALLEDGALRLRSYLEHQMEKTQDSADQVRRWVEGVLSQSDDDIAATTLAVMWNGGGSGSGQAAGRHFGSAPVGALLHEPFAALGSTDPGLDAALAAHATFGKLSDHLWQGTQPSPAETEHIVEFCLAAVTRAR